MSSKVYLDYNATTPVHPQLIPFVTEHLSKFGNPSSVHWAGRETKKLLTHSRAAIAKFLNADPLEIVFTAGGSEGNNLAIKGALEHLKDTNRHEIICATIEHPSVLKTVEFMKSHGYTVRWLPVSKGGSIDLEYYETLLSPKTALVSVQLVNNETGNIFPIKKIAKRAHAAGALIHSDMVQALGKIPVDLHAMDVDLATFAGHKFYALKGAGFLYVKRGTRIESLVHGGAQERSRRAGTENALAIGTLGQACEVLGPKLFEMNESIKAMRDDLETQILQNISGSKINGAEAPRIPNTINVTFDDIDGETLLINLDTKGFAVSSGAACSSGSQEPSPVLTAMGLTSQEASQSLRISLGWLTTKDEVNGFLKNLIESVRQMREIHSLSVQELEREGVIW